MFDSITDALSHLGPKETFLCADFKIDSLGEFRPKQTLDSPKLPHRFQSFHGKSGGIDIYVARTPNIIKNIHYCGGALFEKK